MRPIAERLKEIGKTSRVVFFVATAVWMFNYAATADWTAFTTPFAALTLGGLISGVGQVILLVLGTCIWFAWAFLSEGEPWYEVWAYLGGTSLAAIFLLAFIMKR